MQARVASGLLRLARQHGKQGKDGIVALVNRRPNNPKVFLLRNRSKQSWLVTEADGNQRKVDPGLGIELSSRCEVNFGQVKGTLDPGV